jgi:hypothetical protein
LLSATNQPAPPYVLLAVGDETLETPSMALWLGVLADIISEYAMNDDPRVSTLATQIVAALVSSQAGADLLPGDSPWLADLTVTMSGIEGGFIISCKKRHLSIFQHWDCNSTTMSLSR